MTPVRTQHRGRDAVGPRVCDDMTVEVALSLMAGARVDHLVLCDGDEQSTGLVTLAGLAVLRGSPAYTDRLRLRDVVTGPCLLPGTVGTHDRATGIRTLAG
ncbi:CBS domain-containing protein [Streptomyces spectabilis]|uniref:CBS domain-containing protein n=1 Tax=Streptomyces spectabilis TaxID=68270 RepID=UPI00340E43DA